MGNKSEKFIHNLNLLRELMEETLTPGMKAYNVLVDSKFEGDSTYQLSLGFLTLANQSYLAAKVLYNEQEMETSDIDPFFDTFKDYKIELKQYISKKDDNSSWLSSRHDQFIEGCNRSIRFIADYIKDRNQI